ncbi:hypothetical protein C9E85_08150 [Plesiomonas shigelloides]|nr:hypothetical protein C9E85_08150 [Plesiomonas shigelloides]
MTIPFLLEVAAVLATFIHPNHIVCLCSWGFTHLPPTCNSKSFGYKSRDSQYHALCALLGIEQPIEQSRANMGGSPYPQERVSALYKHKPNRLGTRVLAA